jgi:hypothetical protein
MFSQQSHRFCEVLEQAPEQSAILSGDIFRKKLNQPDSSSMHTQISKEILVEI